MIHFRVSTISAKYKSARLGRFFNAKCSMPNPYFPAAIFLTIAITSLRSLSLRFGE